MKYSTVSTARRSLERGVLLLFASLFAVACGGEYDDSDEVVATTESAATSRASHGGYLYRNGWGGFDWYSPPSFSQSKSTLWRGTMRLQSRFIWQGSGTIQTSEHAGVAYTQRATQYDKRNSPSQPGAQQYLYNFGAGAFVGRNGLALELWEVPRNNTIAWDQYSRCGTFVQRSGSPNLCISSSPSASSHITSRPNFSLVKGRTYWVRVTLSGQGNGWVTLFAELFEGSQRVQTGRIGFRRDQVFPYSESLQGTIFRTPGSTNVRIDAFNYF